MCELDPVLMAEVAEEFSIPRTYSDHREMLAEESKLGLDIVYCIMNERYVLQPALDCIAAGVAVTNLSRNACSVRPSVSSASRCIACVTLCRVR